MRKRVRTVIGSVFLILLVSCSYIVYINQVAPRLTADGHTKEMCNALQRIYDISKEIWDTGDVARLTEIYTAAGAAEEAKWISYNATQDVVGGNIKQIVACKATYYTPAKAEIETTERLWERGFDRHTGRLIVPANPSFLDQARESRSRTVFVNEQGVWKYLEGEEYDWYFVHAEPPSP